MILIHFGYYLNYLKHLSFETIMVTNVQVKFITNKCFFLVTWFEAILVTWWLKWAYAQPDFTSWTTMKIVLSLNDYSTINIIMLFWLIIWWKWHLVCVLPSYMSYVYVEVIILVVIAQ